MRSLLRDGLLDELTLMVHPVVLGVGKRLFKDGEDRRSLELVDFKTFGTGVVSRLPALAHGVRAALSRPKVKHDRTGTGRTVSGGVPRRPSPNRDVPAGLLRPR